MEGTNGMKIVISSLKRQVQSCERSIESNLEKIKFFADQNEDYRKTIDECNQALGILNEAR